LNKAHKYILLSIGWIGWNVLAHILFHKWIFKIYENIIK
jgi:hypothetical protein